MPISSGALDWPVSYYRKAEEEETKQNTGSGEWTPGTTPRRGQQPEYQWQPQLTDRQDYEKWRRMMDRKDPLRTKRKRRNRVWLDCLPFSKVNSELEDVKDNRDNVRDTIKRQRRRRCVLLALCVSVVFLALMIGFILMFLRYTGEEELGPEELMECGGNWRTHYLAYKETTSNGTNYYCCYLSDINDNQTLWSTIQQGPVWPQGYIIDKSKCGTPKHTSMKCEEYKNDFYQQGLPWVPCSAPVGSRVALKVMIACFIVLRFLCW